MHAYVCLSVTGVSLGEPGLLRRSIFLAKREGFKNMNNMIRFSEETRGVGKRLEIGCLVVKLL